MLSSKLRREGMSMRLYNTLGDLSAELCLVTYIPDTTYHPKIGGNTQKGNWKIAS